MQCGAKGVAAGCSACCGGLGELSARQGPGGSGPGVAQSDQAMLC